MASQPCDKCGIDVDPDIQDTCPNCGRRIRGASSPVGWESPSWEDSPTNWETGDIGTPDYETPSTLPPPPSEPPGKRPGRWLSSIAVRVVLGLLIFGGFNIWNAFTAADRDNTGAIVDGGDLDPNDLAVGDCLLDPGEDWFDEVRGVACSDPHDLEIYHLATLPGGGYPSDVQFEDAFIQYCLPAFTPYTGEAFDTSELWIGFFFPDSAAWSAGDRSMQCYLYLPEQMLTRSRAG